MKVVDKEDLRSEVVKLSDTVKVIKEQIKDAEDLILDENQDLKDFQKMMWDFYREMDKGERSQFYLDNEAKVNQLEERVKKCRRLYKIRNNPYFGSIIFNDEPIYIGLTAVKKDLDYLVYDWRAPVCSMFYDFGIGKAEYVSPRGKETGEIMRKRQYKIENGKLKNLFDTNINIDDEILQDTLAQTSSDKLKHIVNTIQAEQNQVIRDFKTNNIIVQGIAGSGKTSVALHRVAFLLYRLEYLTSDNVLIFSPNNVFAEYISEVLPDLGEKNTLQTTYHDFLSAFTSEYTRIESYSAFVERYYKGVRQDNDLIRFKLSDDVIPAIEEYAAYITNAARFIDNLEYKNKVIKIDELNELLYKRYDNKPLFERVTLIAEKINNSYFKGTEKDKISITSKLYKIANFKKDYKAIYKDFFDTPSFTNHYPNMYRKNENERGISDKVIRYEDATPFVYLKFLLEGFPYQVRVREVVIDEAQDYMYLQYKILHKIFKNAHFSILGDVNQTVNPFYKYDTLEVLLNIFSDNSKYILLNKTYRSSPEIIEYANKILGLNHISAIRKTANLPVIKRDIKDLSHIGRDVLYLKEKYKSIAIITKSIDEAKIIEAGLKDKYSKVSLIDIDTTYFNKQLVVAPAYGVKGLEFDSVIVVNNFSNDKYLYYVAVTRAQHELIIYE